MRIFLLPITTRQALIYCQRLSQKPASELTIADKITKKATDTWAKWESAEKGWQKKVVTYGNQGLKRIPYQEWGLKSFPPSKPDLQAQQATENKKFDVVYPGNIMEAEDVPKVLGRLARERKQLHWNRFMGSMIGLPFTIPFALIPIIPNIPFFYLAYRCWSHWRALKGSDHLDFILDHRLFRTVSTTEVEDLYRKLAPNHQHSFTFVTAKEVEEKTAPAEERLMTAGDHNVVAKDLGVPELSGEVERAVWQVDEAHKKQEALKKQSENVEIADEKHEVKMEERQKKE